LWRPFVRPGRFGEAGEHMLKTNPDCNGHFGVYGGRYVAETLMPALKKVEAAFREAIQDPAFDAEWRSLLADYVGRPSPLYLAKRLTADCGGARIYLKREDLNHTGAHKVNNTLGQALLARRMGKGRLMAETGAGQHGVAAATAVGARVVVARRDVRAAGDTVGRLADVSIVPWSGRSRV
jgi:tryptophan synthase beta subunit